MNKKLQAFLLSLLAPGLGYLQSGDKTSFYKTISVFFCVIILGALTRLFTSFWGLILILVLLLAVYVFGAIHAIYKTKQAKITARFTILKLCFTASFLFITGLSFANRRSVMGFDVLSMAVPVMQPAILQGDNFWLTTGFIKIKCRKEAISLFIRSTGSKACM